MLQVKEVRLPALTRQAGSTYCIMCSRGPNRAEHECVRCDITLLAHIAGEMLSPGQVCRAEPHTASIRSPLLLVSSCCQPYAHVEIHCCYVAFADSAASFLPDMSLDSRVYLQMHGVWQPGHDS